MNPAPKIFGLLWLCMLCLSASQTAAQSFGYPVSAAAPAEENNATPAVRYNEIVTQDKAAALQAAKGEAEHILIFYEDFKINHTLSGNVSCSMKISVLPLTKNKVTQLSFQLVWPEITSASNFYDIPPYVKHYKEIALLGEGCYTVDKVPNIVSNRCRIKGKTSEECAALLTWSRVK